MHSSPAGTGRVGPLLPSPGGARQLVMREHENLMPHLSKRAHGRRGPMRDGSAQRHGSWWTIENTGIAAGECDQLVRDYAHARKVNRSGVDNVRKRSGQRMEGAALIVQTEHAVMVVGIGIRDGRFDSEGARGQRPAPLHTHSACGRRSKERPPPPARPRRAPAGRRGGSGSFARSVMGLELLPPHSRRRPARPAAANMPQCETISRVNSLRHRGLAPRLLHAAFVGVS